MTMFARTIAARLFMAIAIATLAVPSGVQAGGYCSEQFGGVPGASYVLQTTIRNCGDTSGTYSGLIVSAWITGPGPDIILIDREVVRDAGWEFRRDTIVSKDADYTLHTEYEMTLLEGYPAEITSYTLTGNPWVDVNVAPTPAPTAKATPKPTVKPTPVPTAKPTPVPTAKPTPVPTARPTADPTATAKATPKPTVKPTPVPTLKPVAIIVPTAAPTLAPTPEPVVVPTVVPTTVPTPSPTVAPSLAIVVPAIAAPPSARPSATPTVDMAPASDASDTPLMAALAAFGLLGVLLVIARRRRSTREQA